MDKPEKKTLLLSKPLQFPYYEFRFVPYTPEDSIFPTFFSSFFLFFFFFLMERLSK